MNVSKPIETRGQFWLPDDPDHKLHGDLSVSESGAIRVDMVGLFGELRPNAKIKLGGMTTEFDRVFGEVERGGNVTLENCLYQPSRLSLSGGLSSSTLLADLAFIGAQFDSKEEMRFSGFTFSAEGLDEWMFVSGISLEQDLENKRGSISYALPDEIVLELQDGLRLKFLFSLDFPQVSIPVTEVGVSQSSYLELEASEPVQIDFVLQLARQICNFLSLATENSVSLRSIEVAQANDLGGTDVHRNKRANVYCRFSSPRDKEVPFSWPRFLFRYSDVEDRLESILVAWLNIHQSLGPVLTQYFENRSQSSMFLDEKCFQLAQAIEALHRFGHPEDTEMPAKTFEVITAMLLQCCPPEHREWLSWKLSHANELTLGKRAKNLIRPFNFWFGNSKERSKFVRELVDFRNSYTHFTAERKEKKASARDLLALHDKLDTLFKLSLLRLIEFGDDNIFSLLQENVSLQRKLCASNSEPTKSVD